MTKDLGDRIKQLRREAQRSQGNLSTVVAEALAVANAIGRDDWALLFEIHLDGLSVSDWEGKDRPPGRKHDETWGWSPGLAAMADRRYAGERNTSGHNLVELEEIHARLLDQLARAPSIYEDDERVLQAHKKNVETEAQIAQILGGISSRVLRFTAEAESQVSHLEARSSPAGDSTSRTAGQRSKVFIGHGRSNAWLELRDLLVDRLGLDVLEFNQVSPAGITTTDRLQDLLDQAEFAFLVLTAEDRLQDGTMAARDNVVHELGMFQGKLGVRRAIAVLEDGCTEFSNIQGLGQIRFEGGRLRERFEEIRKVLEREGLVFRDSSIIK